MAVEVGHGVVPIDADFGPFQRDLQRNTSGALGSIKSFAGKAAAAFAGAFVVTKGVDFLQDAVGAASDLSETVSKSNTIFGPNAKAIESWAGGAAKSFGQSKQQALEAAATFGNMFTQLGVGTEQAADMSTSMTELASDFASFHNADITDVLSAQQAAFRGEYDALQRFVPTITAAAVEQKALAMTGKATTKELTAQEKAIATQALMLEGAGEAMGDFDRTSDGLANKQRILSARFEDVKAKIGQGLLPIVTAAASFIADRVIPVFEQWGPKVAATVQQIASVVQQHWPQIQAVIVGVVQTIESIVTPIIGALQALWANFGDNVMSYVQRVWPPIQQIISGVMTTVHGIIKTVTSLIQGDWSGAWEGVKRIFSGVWSAIQGIVKSAIEQVRFLIGVGMETAGSLIRGAWDGIVGFFTGLPGRISRAASGLFDGIKSAFRSAVNWIIDAWNGLEFKIPGFDPPGPGPSFGGFTLGVPNIPRLHSGGIYESPAGQSEGLALLRDGERVLSPSQTRQYDQLISDGQTGRVVIETMEVHTTASPRSWLDEGLYRAAI